MSSGLKDGDSMANSRGEHILTDPAPLFGEEEEDFA
jgi:fructosamine-3-kinase